MTILQHMGHGQDMIEYVKDRPGHDRRYAIQSHKIQAELGWKPRRTFDEGMQHTIEWYKNNENWWKNVKSGDYQEYYDKWYNKR